MAISGPGRLQVEWGKVNDMSNGTQKDQEENSPLTNPAAALQAGDDQGEDGKERSLAHGADNNPLLFIDPGRLMVAAGGRNLPLAELVRAAENGEIERSQVRIAEITARFETALGSGDMDVTPENMAQFLELCSRLVAWMARPETDRQAGLGQEDGEEESAPDGARLAEYRVFQDAAVALIGQDDAMRSYMSRLVPEIVPVEQLSISPQTLAGALEKVLLRFGATHAVIEPSPIVSVESKITEMRALLSRQPSVLFEELFEKAATLMEVIATFLALLELLRAGEAKVRQKEAFGAISVMGQMQEAGHER